MAEFRTTRAAADADYREGMKSSELAEQARADYARLARENRERFVARGRSELAADFAFGSYTVAKDCIDTEQMHGRWATERLLRSRVRYQAASILMEELRWFLRQRQVARRPAPQQRAGPQSPLS